MKRLYILFALLVSLATFAQAPEGFNYQATVRNSAGTLMTNKNVDFTFKIIRGSATGTVAYSETRSVTTDDLGAVSLVVGKGTPTTGTFSAIDWSNGTYYLGIELNTGSGNVAMGTIQLLSVPYALYSKSAGVAQNQGLSTLYITGNMTNAQAAAQIAAEAGPNTQRIIINNTTGLTSVDLSGIKSLEVLYINDNSNLASINLNGLTKVFDNLNISNNNSLSSLAFPALTVSSHMHVTQNPVLTSISFPVFKTLFGEEMNYSGNALSSSVINTLLHQLVSVSPSASVFIRLDGQTPPAPPTGQGIIDKEILITRGYSVTTDNYNQTITSDAATHYTGETFKFTVFKDGYDVTSQSTISVNDSPLTGNTFYSITTGTFTVKATYLGATSESIQVTVVENPIALTSITVTSSATSVVTGDIVTFTATANNNSNLTQACTYYVNGTAITGNTYTAVAAGTLNIYATYPATTPVTSQTVQIVVSPSINFTKRVLIEDYTGTWSGWVPRTAYAIELVKGQNINAVPVAIHVSAGGGAIDPFNFSGWQTLASSFGVSGFPAGRLNRKTTWTPDETTHIKQVADLTTGVNPRVGLAMNTSMEGNTAAVKVNVKFGRSISGLKLVVYALEDKLIADQMNYTGHYGGKGGNEIIKDFECNNVLRTCFTNLLGDDITGSTNVNEEYTREFVYTVPAGVNAANVHFVAFVIDSAGNALNVRNASNNENQTYEIIQ